MTPAATSSVHLGFLTLQREPAGYIGGYLVTNLWGRPLEFRLSSAVQPNRVQQILYGPTLEPFICADLIGKKLLEKSTAPAQFIFTDFPAALDLRLHVDIPVGLVVGEIRAAELPGPAVTDTLCCHRGFVQDQAELRKILEQLGSGFDLSDPFTRIREALAEARKLGVSNRAA